LAEKVPQEEVKEKEKKPKIKVDLKGSYTKTIESGKKGYLPGNNFYICHDPYNKKYYTFNWIWD
jgi:uncharacterized protein YgiM (DUF1202 family)